MTRFTTMISFKLAIDLILSRNNITFDFGLVSLGFGQQTYELANLELFRYVE